MAKYIESEKAENELDEWFDMYPDSDTAREALTLAKRSIEKLPAADVRPVVLCRDCIYAPSGTDGGDDRGFALEWPHDEWPEDNPCPCKCEDGWYSHKPAPDFFCAAGEKKEES